jgi:SAM-dependent methyltransferase
MASSATSTLKRRERCRLCEGRRLEPVLPLGPSPIADAFVPESRLHERQDAYPLDLYLCLDCTHIQNVDVVDPDVLFRDYIYVTSTSRGLVEHYRKYADDLVPQLQLGAGSLVVDIGSNDGSLLRFFKDKGMRVLGVDPATRIASDATAAGIPTLPTFFTEKVATQIRAEHGAAALITANNVFAHADDLADIVRGIRTLLADDGVFVFEVSYLVDIVDRFVWDTVYHEHVSYHSIDPLSRFFERLGMQLVDIHRNQSKGGSIRGFAQRVPEGRRPVAPIVGQLIAEEHRRGFGSPDIYRAYGRAIDDRKQALNRLLDQVRSEGKTVAGYGASTTVTTLMWHFGLPQKLAYLVDDNPLKQGLFSPGCHLPVYPSEVLYARNPDYVVILAWQYADAIIQRHGRYLEQGGKFIIPQPDLRVV